MRSSPDNHPAIIEQDLWDQVQERLATNSVTRTNQPTGNVTSPLAGRLFDPDGNPMRPSHANNGKRRYRYYVSRDLIEKAVSAGAKGWRIPAEEIETVVARAIVARIEDPAFVSATLARKDSNSEASSQAITALQNITAELRAPESPSGRATLRRITRRIDLGDDRLRARAELGASETTDGDALAGIVPLMIDQPITIVRRGAELRLVLKGASSDGGVPDAPLIRMLIQARMWLAEWRDAKPPMSPAEIAERHGVDAGNVSRVIQLAFLAPGAVESILDGTQPANLTATRLKRIGDLPLLWDEQVALLA